MLYQSEDGCVCVLPITSTRLRSLMLDDKEELILDDKEEIELTVVSVKELKELEELDELLERE